MQKIIADESFIHGLDPNDFKVVSADQMQLTNEYRKYVDKHKIKLEDK